MELELLSVSLVRSGPHPVNPLPSQQLGGRCDQKALVLRHVRRLCSDSRAKGSDSSSVRLGAHRKLAWPAVTIAAALIVPAGTSTVRADELYSLEEQGSRLHRAIIFAEAAKLSKRVLACVGLDEVIKHGLREHQAQLAPVASLAEMRAARAEISHRVDHQAGQVDGVRTTIEPPASPAGFAQGLGKFTPVVRGVPYTCIR